MELKNVHIFTLVMAFTFRYNIIGACYNYAVDAVLYDRDRQERHGGIEN